MLTVTEGRSVELKVENFSLVVTSIRHTPAYRLDDRLAGIDPDGSEEVGVRAPAGYGLS